MGDWGANSSRSPVLPGFGSWLATELRERKISQRQLAKMSGINHSTISRTLGGHMDPSLRTASKLVDALYPATEPRSTRPMSAMSALSHPIARVEYALRSDDVLSEAEVRDVMSRYLGLRHAKRRL